MTEIEMFDYVLKLLPNWKQKAKYLVLTEEDLYNNIMALSGFMII